MTTIRQLDAAIAIASANERISNQEVDGLIDLAKDAVSNSGNPGSTRAAVLDRFDAFAKLKYVGGDKRVVNKLARAVEELTADAKTFTPLGILVQHMQDDGGRTGRTGGAKSGGGKSSGSTPAPTKPKRVSSGGSKSSSSTKPKRVSSTKPKRVTTGGGKSSGSTSAPSKPSRVRTGGSK